MDYDRLKTVVGNDTVVDFEQELYVNSDYSTPSTLQAAYTAMRFPPSVILTFLEIKNQEDPELCLRSEKITKAGGVYAEQLMELVYCRVYCKLLHSSSLKSVTVFM